MKINFKQVVSVILSVVMTASMVGCGNAQVSEVPVEAEDVVEEVTTSIETKENLSKGETVELTFWFANSDTVETYIKDATERFNNTVGAEKGIRVTAEYQGDYVELHQKLQAAYIAGTAPEISVLEIASVGKFAEGGMLLPLDDNINAAGIDMNDFQEGLLYNCYNNQICYSLPFLRSTSILYMNKTLLEEAGVNADEIVTWDDVAKACETVNEKTGKYGISIPMNYWFYEAFMLTEGGFTVNEDETACTVDNDVSRKVISYFQDLSDRGLAHIYPLAESDKMTADLMNQDAAFFFQSTGGLSQIMAVGKEAGFEVQTAFIPKGTQYGVTTGGCNIVMMNGISTEKQKAAWEYINWMTTTEETVEASIATGYLATRKSALEADKMVNWYEQYPQFKVALDQLEYSSGRPKNSGYVEFQDKLTNAISEILVNGADVDTTLAELEQEGNELLK